MKWFKHRSDLIVTDQVLSRLMDEFGPAEGYARYLWLRETIAAAMATPFDRPYAEHPTSKWCAFLHCKPKVLKRFVERLQEISECKATCSGNQLGIEMPNLSEDMDLRACSSRRRSPTGDPKIEERKGKENPGGPVPSSHEERGEKAAPPVAIATRAPSPLAVSVRAALKLLATSKSDYKESVRTFCSAIFSNIYGEDGILRPEELTTEQLDLLEAELLLWTRKPSSFFGRTWTREDWEFRHREELRDWIRERLAMSRRVAEQLKSATQPATVDPPKPATPSKPELSSSEQEELTRLGLSSEESQWTQS